MCFVVLNRFRKLTKWLLFSILLTLAQWIELVRCTTLGKHLLGLRVLSYGSSEKVNGEQSNNDSEDRPVFLYAPSFARGFVRLYLSLPALLLDVPALCWAFVNAHWLHWQRYVDGSGEPETTSECALRVAFEQSQSLFVDRALRTAVVCEFVADAPHLEEPAQQKQPQAFAPSAPPASSDLGSGSGAANSYSPSPFGSPVRGGGFASVPSSPGAFTVLLQPNVPLCYSLCWFVGLFVLRLQFVFRLLGSDVLCERLWFARQHQMRFFGL